jgi:hypothetical protein
MIDAKVLAAEPATQQEATAIIDRILTEIDCIDSEIDRRTNDGKRHWDAAERMRSRESELDQQFSERLQRLNQKLAQW